jgi:aminoglycoside 3-N-acetyltransferase
MNHHEINGNDRPKKYVTREDIKAGLRKLGLKKGDSVGVHSSLSSFGFVEGGAGAVIDALLKVVGEDGTMVMPTCSTNRIEVERTPEEVKVGVTWKYKLLPYNPKETSCWTGAIPEAFRKRKGVLRSLQPTHSKAAMGKHVGEIVEAEDPSALGCWRKLLELGGYILFMGVGLDSCSSMHIAEDRIRLPKHIIEKTTMPKWFTEKCPESDWDVGYGPYPDSSKMEEPCLQHEIMRIVNIGKAPLKLVRLRDLIDLYAEYLRKNPDSFYC